MEKIFININSTLWENCVWNSSCCDQTHKQRLRYSDRNRKSSKTAGMEASRCNFMSRSFLERPIFCFLYSRSSWSHNVCYWECFDDSVNETHALVLVECLFTRLVWTCSYKVRHYKKIITFIKFSLRAIYLIFTITRYTLMLNNVYKTSVTYS